MFRLWRLILPMCLRICHNRMMERINRLDQVTSCWFFLVFIETYFVDSVFLSDNVKVVLSIGKTCILIPR
jgi:hypothetical protein